MKTACDMLKKVRASKAWNRTSAYVIISNDGKIGRIKCAWPVDGMGPVHVFLWDGIGSDLQYAFASGCGYDKLSSALSGLSYDGIKILDHSEKENGDEGNWQRQLEKRGYKIIRAI